MKLHLTNAEVGMWNAAAALESAQQSIIIATKPTKKHEILFFSFVRFRGFRGQLSLIREIKFFIRLN